jgi:hypothetical protein
MLLHSPFRGFNRVNHETSAIAESHIAKAGQAAKNTKGKNKKHFVNIQNKKDTHFYA